MPRRGLPKNFKPRHDKHYIDSLGEPTPESIGLMLSLDRITPNESQPREQIGDLSGLKASIKEKGIIEPLVVKKQNGNYVLISGERRYRAALEIGLNAAPCIIRESDEQDTLEVALIENLQRKDLTAFEEADGLTRLSREFGLSHEEISGKVGKSRSSVTETMTLSLIPDDIRALCVNHGISAKSMLLQIARQETHAEMLSFAQQIIERGMNRAEARSARKSKQDRPKPYTFRKKSREGQFTLTLKFKKTEVDKGELMKALLSVIEELKNS